MPILYTYGNTSALVFPVARSVLDVIKVIATLELRAQSGGNDVNQTVYSPLAMC
jgi:hypothetical protein